MRLSESMINHYLGTVVMLNIQIVAIAANIQCWYHAHGMACHMKVGCNLHDAIMPLGELKNVTR